VWKNEKNFLTYKINKFVYPKKFDMINCITFGFLVYGKFLEIIKILIVFGKFNEIENVENV
jgi:hypothetical protein